MLNLTIVIKTSITLLKETLLNTLSKETSYHYTDKKKSHLYSAQCPRIMSRWQANNISEKLILRCHPKSKASFVRDHIL